MYSVRKRLLTGTAFLLVALAGCGDGPTIVPVAGTLTYKGKPVTNASINFIPKEGRPSVGQTDEEGRFNLLYEPKHFGALVGTHKVSVRHRPSSAAEIDAAIKGNRSPLSQDWAEFFDKYSAGKSTVEVVIDKNTKDLKLDWD